MKISYAVRFRTWSITRESYAGRHAYHRTLAASAARAEFSVEDNGPGIAPEHIPRLPSVFIALIKRVPGKPAVADWVSDRETCGESSRKSPEY